LHPHIWSLHRESASILRLRHSFHHRHCTFFRKGLNRTHRHSTTHSLTASQTDLYPLSTVGDCVSLCLQAFRSYAPTHLDSVLKQLASCLLLLLHHANHRSLLREHLVFD
jgi:hypothetical protein